MILEIAGEMGAVSVGGIHLHLRGEVRQVFMEWLRSYRPDLVERYEELYARGAYAPKPERDRMAKLIHYRRRSVPASRGFESAGARGVAAGKSTADRGLSRAAIQESLF